jgi:hypothetical protein
MFGKKNVKFYFTLTKILFHMKKLQKIILPILFILIIVLIYKVYFSTSKGLGSFSDFDPNNTAVKPITVELLQDRGISQQGGGVVFYVSDKNKQVMMVTGEMALPDGIESAKVITVKGHLTQGGFHAHEVVIE